MKNNQFGQEMKVLLSIIAFIISTAATFIILILFFFSTGLFGWSDGGDPAYLKRLEISTIITLVFSIIVALFIGIYIVIKINKPKRKDNDSFLSDN